QCAVGTEGQVERVGRFRPVELLGGQQGVGQRRAAQRQDEVQPWPATGTADGHRGIHAALPKTGRPGGARPSALADDCLYDKKRKESRGGVGRLGKQAKQVPWGLRAPTACRLLAGVETAGSSAPSRSQQGPTSWPLTSHKGMPLTNRPSRE